MEMIQEQASPATPPQAAPPPPTRPRCQYVSRNGKPCRYRVYIVGKPFCKYHIPPDSPEELAVTLERMAGNFDTPENVTNVLYTIFFSLVDGTISERKAGLLTYIAQTILHSHRAMQLFAKTERQLEEQERFHRPIICDLPGPIRDDEPEKKAKPDVTTENTETKAEAGKDSAGAPGAEGSAGSESEGSPPAEQEKTTVLNTGHYTNPPPADLNHFFPVDPALPAHLQDPNRVPAPPLSQAEIDRRNRQFDRAQGIARRGRQSHPAREAPDWKILNGR